MVVPVYKEICISDTLALTVTQFWQRAISISVHVLVDSERR